MLRCLTNVIASAAPTLLTAPPTIQDFVNRGVDGERFAAKYEDRNFGIVIEKILGLLPPLLAESQTQIEGYRCGFAT